MKNYHNFSHVVMQFFSVVEISIKHSTLLLVKKNNENVRDCTKIGPLSLLWIGGSNGIGFEEFIYKSIVPATFMAPMKSTFNLADAQTILVGSFNLVFYLKILFFLPCQLSSPCN